MHIPYTPQGVIFDMDGLLIDTIPLYIKAMSAAGVEVQYPVSDVYLRSLIGLLGQELRDRLVRDLGAAFPVEAFFEKSHQKVAVLLSAGAPLKAGAAECVTSLASAGVPIAVATSMTSQEAEHQLEHAQLRELFRAVVGRDQVQHSKPYPDVYLKAAAFLQIPAHTCIALEDSFNGIRSAYAAGCMVIMVPDLLAPTDEITACCVGIARDLCQVQALLQKE